MPERTVIELVAGRTSTGEPVLEEVLVDRVDDGTYRIAATPGLVLGVAAGDVIRVSGADAFEILERGGNLAVQVYGPRDVVADLTKDIWALGGALDGGTDTLTVYTVPVAAGFEAVERVLHDFASRFPDVEWYFGNVYDTEDGVTPLNWWR